MPEQTGHLEKEALDYLSSQHVMTLATAGAEGPWATALFYVNRGFTLYFFTEGRTLHGRNMTENPAVAASISRDSDDWREIKGIQISGKVYPVGMDEKVAIICLFTRKYTAMNIFLTGNPAAVARADVYKLVPGEIWYLDNKRGFSKRQKLILE